MFCLPAVFVVAIVTEDSPSVSVPEYCEKVSDFCSFQWPLTIKVEQVLASRPSNFPEEILGFQRGSILRARVGIIATRRVAGRGLSGVEPDDWQGRMFAPYSSGDDAASALRKKKFIFGLFDVADRPSQIWSMSFQGRLERTLMEAADNQPEYQRQCPSLIR
jgi:hypothetical protein